MNITENFNELNFFQWIWKKFDIKTGNHVS